MLLLRCTGSDIVWSVEHPPDVYTTLQISIFEIKFETIYDLVAFEVRALLG